MERADSARILGRADAPVWVIEISDYQCPYCARFHEETFDQLRDEFIANGTVRFAYLHFPLPNHPHAWPAAEATMCAGEQGRFWEVHDAVFRTQSRWAPLEDAAPVFDSVAVAAGVEMQRWRQCVKERAMRPVIQADYDRSIQAGVQSTPSFIVGEQALVGAVPIEVMREAIQAAVAARGATPQQPQQPAPPGGGGGE